MFGLRTRTEIGSRRPRVFPTRVISLKATRESPPRSKKLSVSLMPWRPKADSQICRRRGSRAGLGSGSDGANGSEVGGDGKSPAVVDGADGGTLTPSVADETV